MVYSQARENYLQVKREWANQFVGKKDYYVFGEEKEEGKKERKETDLCPSSF